jgi:hypothetical protein
MYCQQGGKVWACFGLLNVFRRFSGGFEQFLGSVVHRSDRLRSPVWPVRVLVLFICWAPVWPVVLTGLTRQSWVVATGLFAKWFACIRPGGVALIQGELACVQGELFVVFELWFDGLRSLLEHSFISDVSSRCPCLRGPRLVFFKWSCFLPFLGFRSLVGVFSFISFLFFFSQVTICVCCQCTHQGGDWGPCVVRGPEDGRFLMWWVIDNIVWTYSWLSIAGAGCGSTGVCAGEEQAWKVISGEASRCGEDN